VVDFLVRASIPAIVFTVFAIARRYLPARSARAFGTAYSIDELSLHFAFTQWLVNAGMLAIGTVIALTPPPPPGDPSTRKQKPKKKKGREEG